MSLCICGFVIPVCMCIILMILPPLGHGHYMDTAKAFHDGSIETVGVKSLLTRILGPDSAKRFQVEVEPDDMLPRHTAEIVKQGLNKVKVTGNSGVAVAWALNIYLSQYAGCHFSWSGNQIASLPSDKLPDLPSGRLSLTSLDDFTAYPNVCTFGYSYVWWNFSDWQNEIDWMALHGINLVYAATAQEHIFGIVFKKFGMVQKDLDDYFSGPAFLPWNRMGNLKKWGGPLSMHWNLGQFALQKKILKRMKELGIHAILPGFNGIVPDALIRLYPKLRYSRLSNWCDFGSNYSELVMLDPREELFTRIGIEIIKQQKKFYGDYGSHFYAIDSFNEVEPSSGDLAFLGNLSTNIFALMKEADNKGIWVQMTWFLHSRFWTNERVKALLNPIPLKNLLLLDLDAETSQLYEAYHGYFGHSFLWQTLINFGGNNAMFGSLTHLMNPGPFNARSKYANLIGTGIDPEGMGQNDVIFEMALEFNWRRTPVTDIHSWAQGYAVRRYGSQNNLLKQAWKLLAGSIYSGKAWTNSFRPLITRRPSLKLTERMSYDKKAVEMAWHYFLLATNDSSLHKNHLFKHDLVDVTRQILQIKAVEYYQDFLNQINSRNVIEAIHKGYTILYLLDEMDSILGTDKSYLLQNVIEKFKYLANSSIEKKQFEFNIRNQLTLWGPSIENANLLDYGAKMWNGLIKHYYIPRWRLFIDVLISGLITGKPFNIHDFNVDVFHRVEQIFCLNDEPTGPSTPQGNPILIALDISKNLPNISKERIYKTLNNN